MTRVYCLDQNINDVKTDPSIANGKIEQKENKRIVKKRNKKNRHSKRRKDDE